jgi:large subunit ribosomal protein L4
MKLKLYSSDASKVSEVEVKSFPEIDEKKGVAALKQYLVAYMANQRQGNASTKNRGDKTSIPGKKWGPQKGSGGARHGDKTAPQFKGGAVAFGPKPRKYTKKINAKTKKLAFQRALFERAQAGKIALIERFDLQKPATKELNIVLSKITPKGKMLIIDDTFAAPAILSARNIERVSMSEAALLNAFDLIRYPSILVTQKGFEKLIARAV